MHVHSTLCNWLMCFFQGKCSRTMSLQMHSMVIFRNRRDVGQIQALARQTHAGRSKVLLESFEDATKEPYSYLVVDCSPQCPESLRLRSKVFPSEHTVCYIPKVGP